MNQTTFRICRRGSPRATNRRGVGVVRRRVGWTGERLLPRFKVFCGKGPYPAKKMFLGAWDPRFGDEAALLECLWSIVYDVDDVVKDLQQEVWI